MSKQDLHNAITLSILTHLHDKYFQEWLLCNDISTKKHTITQEYRSLSGQQVAYSVSCTISRRPGFFIVNTIMLMVSQY
jgi:hypothetical protein